MKLKNPIKGQNINFPDKKTLLKNDSFQNYQEGIYGVYDGAINIKEIEGLNLCYRFMDLWIFAGIETFYQKSRYERIYIIPEFR
mgnify:CR=1 FL=1